MIRKRLHRYSMLKRYGQIIEVLQKYGFGYIVDQIGLSSISDLTYRFKNKDKMDKLNTSGPVRARKILEELGPTYIKVRSITEHEARPCSSGICYRVCKTSGR